MWEEVHCGNFSKNLKTAYTVNHRRVNDGTSKHKNSTLKLKATKYILVWC